MLGAIQLRRLKSAFHRLGPKWKTRLKTSLHARKLERQQNQSRTLPHLFMSGRIC